jgi:hypothetical protein
MKESVVQNASCSGGTGRRVGRAHETVEDEDKRRQHDGEQHDRLVLPREKGLGAFLDRVGDLLHRRGPVSHFSTKRAR